MYGALIGTQPMLLVEQRVMRPAPLSEVRTVGDWESEHEHRVLVHISDGGSGMREYARPLKVGDELTDGGERYRVVRVQERETRGWRSDGASHESRQ